MRLAFEEEGVIGSPPTRARREGGTSVAPNGWREERWGDGARAPSCDQGADERLAVVERAFPGCGPTRRLAPVSGACMGGYPVRSLPRVIALTDSDAEAQKARAQLMGVLARYVELRNTLARPR